MFSLPRDLKLEGQQFIFNPNSKCVILEITEPFVSAGNEIGWNTKTFGTVGFGVNKSIVEFVESRKCHLVVYVLKWNFQYWLNYDKLRHFIKFNPCEHTTKSGKILYVVPKGLFSEKPQKDQEDSS